MSTINTSATKTNNNANFFQSLNFAKTSKIEETKDHCTARKIQTQYFIPDFKASKNTMQTNTSAKSHLEEFMKLQAEISYVEERIRELETAKQIKENKVILSFLFLD